MSTTTDTAADQNALAQGKSFVWHELYAPDADKAIGFYTEALDFGTHEMDMGPMGTYKMLTRGGVPVCGVLGTATDPRMKDVPTHWSTYLGVDDVDARLAKCQEMGAKLIHGPMDVPTVGRMALIEDPFGATIWLFKPGS